MATTTNFGWETPDDTDLVKDGALAIRTLGSAIDTSLVDLKGGTTGQVLSKTSNTDMDFTWVTSDDANAIQNAIVDAKGDLIAASAADTPARLAVGNNGETLVADSSQTTGLRYNPQNALANPVINGGFDIWQRGTSFASSATSSVATSYTADRWNTFRDAWATGATFSRQTVSDSTNLPNIQYALRLQRNSGNTSTANLYAQTSFESVNSIPFAGKTVTLTYYARAGSNFSATSNAFNVIVYTGTGTDQNVINGYTGVVTAVNTTNTLTTSFQRFAHTFAVGSTATEIALTFAYTPTGTASTNDYADITGVQIDFGTYTASTAPTFRRSGGTLAGELAACQRYFQTYGGDSTRELMSTGMVFTSTRGYLPTPFSGRMRTSPTVTFSNVAHFSMQEATQAWPGTSFTLEDAGPTSAWLDFTASTAAMTGGRALIFYGNSTSARLELSAEL